MVNDTSAKWIDPNLLVPWDKNPRNNDLAVENLKKAIEMFGFTSPIIVRKATNQVIAGHTRLKAALSLGLKAVPVRFLEISESKARQLAIADNKLGEIATWNDDELGEELKVIFAEMEDFDFSAIGFSEEEIDKLVNEDFGSDEYQEESDSEQDHNGLTQISFSVPTNMSSEIVDLIEDLLREKLEDYSVSVKAKETLH